MKPRRLHSDTIFSMRAGSVTSLLAIIGSGSGAKRSRRGGGRQDGIAGLEKSRWWTVAGDGAKKGHSAAFCLSTIHLSLSTSSMTRCPWLPLQHPLYVDYHDTEWGVPSRDPRYLFECICLEGAQAGLSWWTLLQKRERYRQVVH